VDGRDNLNGQGGGNAEEEPFRLAAFGTFSQGISDLHDFFILLNILLFNTHGIIIIKDYDIS